jgi:hypothetical protein
VLLRGGFGELREWARSHPKALAGGGFGELAFVRRPLRGTGADLNVALTVNK